MIAVLAGPPVMECSSSPDGLASCLRDRLSGVGLLPNRETPATPDDVGEPDAQPEQLPDGTPTEAEQPARITLLRAEPDGSLVVAGTGEPGAEITVYADGTALGSATPEASGDWALVPDAALPAGETSITLDAQGDATEATAFVVTIDPEQQAEARIVARHADGSEEILAGDGAPDDAEPSAGGDDLEPQADLSGETAGALGAADARAALSTAAAEQASEAAEAAEQASEAAEAAEQASEAAEALGAGDARTALAAAPEPVPTFDDPVVAEVPAPAATAPAQEASEAAEALGAADARIALEAAPEPVPMFDGGVVAEVPAPAATLPVDTASEAAKALGAADARTALAFAPEPAGTFDGAVVADVPAPAATELESEAAEALGAADARTAIAAAPAPDPAGPDLARPTIDAIEIDGDTTYIAGTGQEGAVVTVLVDGVVAGQSPVEGGHWLVEAHGLPLKPSQRVSAEIAVTGSGTASSEVDFVIDLPLPSGALPVQHQPAETPTRWAVEVVAEIPAIGGSGERGPLIDPLVPPVLPLVDSSPEIEPLPVPGLLASDGASPARRAASTATPRGDEHAPPGLGTEAAPSLGHTPAVAGAETAADPGEPADPTSLAADTSPSAPAALKDWSDAPIAEVPAPVEIAALPAATELPEADRGQGQAAVVPLAQSGSTAEAGEATRQADEDVPRADPVAGLDIPSVVESEVDDGVADVIDVASAETSGLPAEVPTIRVTAPDDAAPIRYASGEVIIRRGDTLWDISRRVYGSGAKYQTIYRANRDRIPRPGRIYPGQVLDVPLVYD